VDGGAPKPPPSAPAPHIPIQTAAAPLIPIQSAAGKAAQSGPNAATAPAGLARAGKRKGLVLLLSAGVGLLLLAVILVVVSKAGKGGEDEDEDDPNAPPMSKSQRKINKAIQRGVAYLKNRLLDGSQLYSSGDNRGGGANPGAVALAGLTLLECGTSADDPAVQQALKSVRGQARQLTFTYSISLAILFLDRFNNPKERKVDANDRELIKNMALRLIAGQNRNAGWGYYCDVLTSYSEQNLLKQLREDNFQPGTFSGSGGLLKDRDDNSIGQFATLALWAARKHGVPVRPCLQPVEARYRPRQRGDGSWQYNEMVPFARDTSTCAGLIGLAVARGVEAEAQPSQGKPPADDITRDPAVQNGLRYLANIIGKTQNLSEAEQTRRRQHTERIERLMRQMEAAPDLMTKQRLALELRQLDWAPSLRGIYIDGDNWGDLYFLWSLERMAVIYDLKLIEGKDWYAWGSDIIVSNQEDDGSWSERFPGVPDTCFALLFLRRANIVKDLTDKLRERRLAAPAAAAPPADPAPPRRKE
jgi:hypothetical protein